MGKFVVRRLISVVPLVFLVCLVSFIVIQILPGDAAMALLGEEQIRDDATYEALRKELGLDRPIYVQFISWLGEIVAGDFGKSARTGEPVLQALTKRFAPTAQLTIMSLILGSCIGFLTGLMPALKPNSMYGSICSIGSLVGVAIPNFWLGLLMIYLFSLRLGWLPPSGYVPFSQDPEQSLRLMVMPAIALGTSFAAVIQRQTKAAIAQVLSEDYVRTARSKGLRELTVIVKHALKNAAIPVLTVIGMQVGRLFGGAVTVEIIFRIPGIGRLAVDSIHFRDFRMLQGVVIVMALAVLATNLLVDFLYTFLDPRIIYD
jgi:peptide/nickel transport system permease protein